MTSTIIFSDRSALSKGMAISGYFVSVFFKLIWKILLILARILQELFEILFDWWFSISSRVTPSYDIRSQEELYHLYKRVEQSSGLPWQVFWGIHAEETNLGRNLGSVQVFTVLPISQRRYFQQMCRELYWDPERIYGSHKGAIGPFQFMPETWVRYAVDGNNDGRKDPFNLEDAAYSAANYLLRKGGMDDLQKAIWHYNQDSRYVRRIMRYLNYS
jgi:membrane-bound lytic murein transglycosylase B